MPPEPSKGKLKRKASRREMEEYRFDGGHTREIEQKRNNGQISCAECRRLKIKCDKQIPCQSCQRRGCAALCPNGSLSTGQGTRFVLAATEHLHRRIAKMGERIRQLEDALGELQGQHSTDQHPLLCDEVMGALHKDEEPTPPPEEMSSPGHPSEMLDAFGTLSITDHGISRFFGPTGGSECLLMSDNVAQQDGTSSPTPDPAPRDSDAPHLHQDLRMLSQAFPFAPMGPTGPVRELIEGHLPNWERASYLTQTYCEQAGWLYHGVSKDQIVEELLPIYYSNGPLKATEDNKSAHDLALLFLVFAIGALVDLTQEPENAEAEHYHQIARAAVSLQSVLEKPSLVTIQALHMFSIYNAMSGNELSAKETSMETTWSLIVLAAHLSQTVGLHRDSMRWGLPDKIVHRRRVIFWDLFVADAWHCLSTGRPPSFSRAYIDCRFPGGGDPTAKRDGDLNAIFESWGYRFSCDCVADVAARTLTAELPNYATITELDSKIREFPVPDYVAQVASSLAAPVPTLASEDLPIPESMGRFVMAHAREVILLYIHRSFFAQAIMENPVNPLKSQYAPSFLATYRASSTILRTIRAQYAVFPHLCERFWSIWTFGFSAAIVFGAIVTRGPHSPLASNAIKELDEACVLFAKAAGRSRRAAKALPILTKLSEKGHAALNVSQGEKPSGQLGQQWSVTEECDGDDELAIFAGRTRFVSTRRTAKGKDVSVSGTGGAAPVDGMRPSGFGAYSAGVVESSPVSQQIYHRAEGSGSSTVQRWTHTPAQAERDPLQYPVRSGEFATAGTSAGTSTSGIPPPIMPQWRPPRRSHYSYATHHHPQSHTQQPHAPHQQHSQHQHLAPPPVASPLATASHEHTTTPSYPWGQPSSSTSPFGSTSYPTSNGSSQSHSHSYSTHAHTHSHSLAFDPPSSSSVAPSRASQPQHAQAQPPPAQAPSELTELGLVSQESRIHERWTSFMRDSGYFEGFGYRNR